MAAISSAVISPTIAPGAFATAGSGSWAAMCSIIRKAVLAGGAISAGASAASVFAGPGIVRRSFHPVTVSPNLSWESLSLSLSFVSLEAVLELDRAPAAVEAELAELAAGRASARGTILSSSLVSALSSSLASKGFTR